MSLWVAALSRGGLSVVTDSAIGYADAEGPHATSGEKLWKWGDVWIAAAASLRVALPPAPWPNPWLDGENRPRTFKEVAHGIADQMADGRCSRGPLYDLAIIGAGNGVFPKLAKVSNEKGVEFARPGAIFTGGFAAGVGGPAEAPTELTKCRTLAIAMASRAIRAWGDQRNTNAGPAIAWPLNYYVWDGDGRMGPKVVILEAEAPNAEWGHWANSMELVVQAQFKAKIAEVALDSQSKGLWPEKAPRLENVQLNWSLPSPPADPTTTTSEPAAAPQAAPISEEES